VTNTLNEITKRNTSEWWLTELEKQKIGCGPINTLSEVFSDPHVKAREMIIEMEHAKTGKAPLKLIANPIKMHETPPSYRLSPPLLGEHTEEILSEKIGLSLDEIKNLKDQGII
jgi:crotonobetainyl-CoA:carnitine CoA-transferase CaiB-like acyl-CoA transferase